MCLLLQYRLGGGGADTNLDSRCVVNTEKSRLQKSTFEFRCARRLVPSTEGLGCLSSKPQAQATVPDGDAAPVATVEPQTDDEMAAPRRAHASEPASRARGA